MMHASTHEHQIDFENGKISGKLGKLKAQNIVENSRILVHGNHLKFPQ
jgi:hypothetical protein